MMGPPATAPSLEGSALSVQGPQIRDSRSRKGRLWCDYCRKPGHLKETCWKLHGKPADWKFTCSFHNREAREHLASSDESHTRSETTVFSKEHIDFFAKSDEPATFL